MLHEGSLGGLTADPDTRRLSHKTVKARSDIIIGRTPGMSVFLSLPFLLLLYFLYTSSYIKHGIKV